MRVILNLNRNKFSFPLLFRLPGRMNHTKKSPVTGKVKIENPISMFQTKLNISNLTKTE